MSNKQGPRIWGIRAGKNGSGNDVFMQGGLIALEDAGLGDLSELEPFRDDYYGRYRELHPDETRTGSAGIAGKFFRFAVEVEKRDLVVYPNLLDKQVYVGEVVGDYEFISSNEHFPHRRSVKWKFVIPKAEFSLPAQYELGAARTFFEFRKNASELRQRIAADGVRMFRTSEAPRKTKKHTKSE